MSETFLQAVKSGQSSQDGETKVSVKEKEKTERNKNVDVQNRRMNCQDVELF